MGTKAGRAKQKNVNTDGLTKSTAVYVEETNKYKALAEARRKAVKYNQEYAADYAKRIGNYIEEQQKNGRPLTVSGVVLASGVSDDTFRRMRSGEYDYRLYEYIDINNIDIDTLPVTADGTPVYTKVNGDTGEVKEIPLAPFSRLIEKTYLLIREQQETNCNSMKGNPVGNIFLLKALHGYQEQATTQNTTNNLIIATESDALEALKRIK